MATRAPVAPPPPRAFAARGSGDPPGTPAHRSRARRPPCRGRPSTSGPSREPARPQLSAHSFPATLPAPKRYCFWPNAAAVGSTSCFPDASSRRSTPAALGSCACAVGSHPGSGLCRPRGDAMKLRCRRGHSTGGGARRGLPDLLLGAAGNLQPGPYFAASSQKCSPGVVTASFVTRVPSPARGQTLSIHCRHVPGHPNLRTKESYFHLQLRHCVQALGC